jgi:hypothetical protein
MITAPVRLVIASSMVMVMLLAGCGGGEQVPKVEAPRERPNTKGSDAIVPVPASLASTAPAQVPPVTATVPPQSPPALPTPPLLETFDKEPVLSLFPRAGDYRPEEKDERLPYWATFIDHLTRISGIVQEPKTGNRAWSFRGINTIDSVGWFSPVAVQPNTSYTVSFRLKTELPDGGAAGIGILEFNEFLWVGEQYPESLVKQHLRGAHSGLRLTGSSDFEPRTFTFSTGPRTRMVHLVLFREGAHNRNGVLFDDIAITPTPGQ